MPARPKDVRPREPLNTLFIFADQLHAFGLGCTGSMDAKTPNLDALASKGLLFTNCYSVAPICTPYRACLYTGRYASQNGTLHNNDPIFPGERTLADALEEGGVATSYVGKWHLGASGSCAVPQEFRGGFRRFIGYQCYNDYLDTVEFYDEDNTKHVRNNHRTDATTDIAIERLEELRGKRFHLSVSYQNPHYPEQPSPEFDALFKDAVMARRPNSREIDPYTRTISPPRSGSSDPTWQRYHDDLNEYLRLYNAMVAQLDANVGRLLAALESFGMADTTAVFFSSDHGDMQGSQGMRNKCSFHEESAKVPFIAYVPGGVGGLLSDGLCSTVDLMPTLLDAARLPAEPTCEGRSLLPRLLGEAGAALNAAAPALNAAAPAPNAVAPAPDVVFSEDDNQGSWFMIRDKRWKLAVNRSDLGPTNFYDMVYDPFEMSNLADALLSKDSGYGPRSPQRIAFDTLRRRLGEMLEDMRKRRNPALKG